MHTFDVFKNAVPVGSAPFCVAVCVPCRCTDNEAIEVGTLSQLRLSEVCRICSVATELLHEEPRRAYISYAVLHLLCHAVASLHGYLLDDASNVFSVAGASAEEDAKLRQADVSPLLNSKGAAPGQRCATRA